MSKKIFLSFMAVVVLVSVLGAASTVVLYTSNKTDLVEFVASQFEKETGITVSVVRAGTGSLMQRLAAESANPLADVFWSGSVGTLKAFQQYFAEYESPQAAAVPSQYRSPDNLWTSCMTHVMVIMYNKDLVSPADVPTTWEDLFAPKWRGKIAMGNPETSGSSYAQFYGILDLYGWQGIRKLAKNVVIQEHSSSVYKNVYLGEYPLGITMEYAAYGYIAGGASNIGIVYPSEGTILDPEGVALIKGGPNANEGKKFYDWLLSKPVREEIFAKFFRRPVRTDIDVTSIASELPSMKDINISISTTDDEVSSRREHVLQQWKNIIEEVGR